MTRTGSRSRADAQALAALLAAVVLYFWPWITMSRVFYQVDIAFMDQPLRVHAFEMIRAGRFPFWSSGLLCGFPVFAEGQAAVLYPLSWLYFLLPPLAALNTFVVVHYLILALGTYLLLRAQPLGPAAAAFGTLTIVFSSFMLVEHVLLGFLSVAAWTPFLLWLQLRFLRRGRAADLALAGLVVALLHLAGSPLETLVVLTLLLLVGLASPGVEEAPPWPRRLAAATVPAVLGTLLAAPQLLATLEFLRESTRAAGAVVPRLTFLSDAALLTLVFPRFLGLPTGVFVGPKIPGWEETLFLFVGWAPLFLAVLGFRRRGATAFWLVVSLAAVALSVQGLYPVSRYFRAIPPFSLFRWPSRLLLWYAIGAGVLAAHGYERLCGFGDAPSPAERRSRLRLLAGLGVAACGVLLVFRRGLMASPPAPGELDRVLAVRDQDLLAFVGSFLLLLVVAAVPARRGGRALLGVAAFATLALGVFLNVRPDGVPPDVYEKEPATAPVARAAQGDHGRILALTPWAFLEAPVGTVAMRQRIARLPANIHLLFGLRAAGQFDMPWTTTLRRNRTFLVSPSPQVLELLAVNAVVPGDDGAPPDPYSWTLVRPGGEEALVAVRRGPLSRAFLADHFVVLADEEARRRWIENPHARLRETVVLATGPTWAPSGSGVARPATRDVAFLRDEPDHVELRVATPDDALLVLADSDYPGWQASVDGVEVPTYAANGFVRAVAVPAGTHRVAFAFRDRWLRTGLAVTLGTLGLAGALLWFRSKRRVAAPPVVGPAIRA